MSQPKCLDCGEAIVDVACCGCKEEPKLSDNMDEPFTHPGEEMVKEWRKKEKEYQEKGYVTSEQKVGDMVNSPADSASRAVSIELTDSLVKRFWNKVSDDGCWEWRGSKTRGYGTLAVGKGKSPVYAHRVSYAIHKGDPGNMLVLHHCDNPSCVNPDHLYLGTDQDNSNDAWERGRAVLPTNVPKGEDHPHGKLTASDVESILKSLKAGFSCAGLADEFGVSKQAIWKIKHGQSWKEISRD